MKFILITLVTLLASAGAFASSDAKLESYFTSNKSNQFCKANLISDGNGGHIRIRVQQKFFDPYLIRVQKSGGQSEVTLIDINTNKKHIYDLNFNVSDVLFDRGHVLILSNAGLHVGTMNSKKLKLFKTTSHDYSEYENYPTQMVARGQYLFVAHGGVGVSVLARDGFGHLFTNRYNDQVNKGSQRSAVNGIALRGDNVYLALDNITYDFKTKKRAFEGMIRLSSALKVEKIIPLNQGREAYHNPILINTPSQLIMQNLHLLFTYNDSALKNKTAEPTKRLFKFKDGELFGKPLIYNNRIYGCFLKYENDEFILKSNVENL